MKKKKKLNRFWIRRMFLVALLIVLIGGIANRSYHRKHKNQTASIGLLFNYEFVKLSAPIYVENSVLYMAQKDIQSIFDDTIYYNIENEELITTYNKHIAILHLNEKQMTVNDSKVPMQGELKQIDSQIYLPISDLEIVYDIETQFNETTNLVIVDSTTKAQKKAIVLKEAKIKSSKSPFARTIEKLHRGDEVYVVEESGSYSKVRSSTRQNWLFEAEKSF